MKRTTLTVLGAVTLLVLAGCSSGQDEGIASAGGTATASQGADPASDEEQALEFTKCMRDNGIELPDPVPDGDGGFDFGITDADVELDDPVFRKALQECRDSLPGGNQPNLDDPETQAQLREFAKCMRENGYPDFPDPDGSGGFGAILAEIDPASPNFQQATDACRDKLPERSGR